jgi:hypothetical protein
MKKLTVLFMILAVTITAFGQYTEDKLPSGLIEATTLDTTDYMIVQKNGETYVKAAQLKRLQSVLVQDIPEVDSVNGVSGQFIVSDGVGWLSTADALYEGNSAFTFGSRGTGNIGLGSFAIGYNVTASDSHSFAHGTAVFATGSHSFASGINTTASGNTAVAFNYKTEASGNNSVAFNYKTEASGTNSFSAGIEAISNSFLQTAFGQFNDTTGTISSTSWNSADRLFVIGNGTSTTRNNAFEVYKNGNTNIDGNLNVDSIYAIDSTQVVYLPDQTDFLGSLVIGNGGQSLTSGGGRYNTFVGIDAGASNTSGNYNTFNGNGAGYSNTTGYNNTFNGYYAGYSNTTGRGNVFLGNRAGFNETGSNKLYIENTQADSSGALIYGEFDNDFLRFNNSVSIDTTRGEALEVNGNANIYGFAKADSFTLSDMNTAPASATATGTKGEIRITADYIYVCTATNTWKRAALATW